jgi:hypothetical protein
VRRSSTTACACTAYKLDSSNMCSNERYPHPLANRPSTTAVMVSLDALFPPPQARSTADGLELRGWAPGALQRWERADTGEWIGMVTFLIKRSDGSSYRAVDQLVPAGALRPQ